MGPFDTYVFDLDGVLYRGEQPVPGVGELLAGLEAAGKNLVFATNNSTTTEEDVAGNIARRTGFTARPEVVVTSGLATARRLAGEVDNALVIGGAGLPIVLERNGVPVTTKWQDADCVVVGLDRTISYDKLLAGTHAIRNGARFVATNHDPTFPTPSGLAPGAGAIVAALERSSETTAEVMGKPHAAFASAVAELAAGEVVVVGDRIDSDMALARNNGWTAILVLSGVTTAEQAGGADVDLVLSSAAALEF